MKLNIIQIIVILGVIGIIVGTITFVNAQGGGFRISPFCQATSVTILFGANSYEGYSNYRAWLKAGDCEKIISGRVETTVNVPTAVEQDIRINAPRIYISPDGFDELEVQYRGRFAV